MRVIALGIDASVLDEAVASADELTFHRLLGEMLPAESRLASSTDT